MSSYYMCLDISEILNNIGSTNDNNTFMGNLSFGGESFPESCIPFNEYSEFFDVPFLLKKNNNYDNFLMEEQILQISQINITKVHFLGTSSDSSMVEEISLLNNNQIVHSSCINIPYYRENSILSNNKNALEFPYVNKRNGNKDYHSKTFLWYDVVELSNNTLIDAIKFEDNPCIHIFAITFEAYKA